MKGKFVILAWVILGICVSVSYADLYLHSPRGSNNRLNEQSATRNNANRLFDSQNNNRGGYNVGVEGPDNNGANQATQSRMTLYPGALFEISWTNQHGAGDNPNLESNHVLEYLCRDDVRNGANTQTPDANADNADRGLHETRAWYNDCQQRPRNQGLWTADQNLNGDAAVNTRQNPNGNQNGYECPEERDYYPYWIPSPWRPIAYLTSEEDRCPWIMANALEPPPYCGPQPWSRDNHLGNTYGGYNALYNWEVPTPQEMCGQDECQCVLRMRYNMSTTDSVWVEEDGELKELDYWLLNATYNDAFSPLRQNPYVDIDVDQVFRLAINTAQTARTFQDRSHVFTVTQRPEEFGDEDVYHVIVRGKRGNIVQTYPAVEYDFTPNRLEVKKGAWVCFEWEGSNTHNNNAPGGDGQTGDDGQGTGGTDRSNIVQISDLNFNYPTHISEVTLFTDDESRSFPPRSKIDLINDFATLGLNANIDPLLNNASPHGKPGCLRMTDPGEFHYMCTRNNNFSNRSQKATIIVKD